MKIISFNIGTTHLMHFNRRIVEPTGETVTLKNDRAKEIKFNIISAVNKENADILCIQEGFNEALPRKYSNLIKIGSYPIKHGKIASGNTSYLSTYINLRKYRHQENFHFNDYYQSIHNKRGVGYPCRTQIFELTEIETHKRTVLVNFHGVGSPDIAVRRNLLDFLSRYLKTIYPRDNVIIVGDINTNLRRTTGDRAEIDFAEEVREGLFDDFDVFPKNDRKKSSYHRFIREDDLTFTEKPPADRYDCLDFCLVKKQMGQEVNVKRIPERFVGKEVPYKLNKDLNILLPNFEQFPSDHTLNVYTFKNRPGFLGLNPGIRIPRKQSKKGRSTSNLKTRKRKIKNSKVASA